MRKILFRAKSFEKDNLGKWIYGDLTSHHEHKITIVGKIHDNLEKK